jgi:tRNA threonylcarbamoyladenosine biosynthesis protein TsaB
MGSAALLRDSQVVAEISGYEETPYSTRLFRDVALLQRQENFSLDQIDVFAVAAGPGSFTGLRVGLTAVKAWAEVHGKPIAPVSGLQAIAAESLEDKRNSNGTTRYIAPFLDARRGQLFGAVYKCSCADVGALTLDSQESIFSIDEFLALIGERSKQALQLVSPSPELLPFDRLMETMPEARILKVSGALASAIGRLGYEKAQLGELVDAIGLDANYVRRSDAEARWKEA